MSSKPLDEMMKKFSEMMPENLRQAQSDFEKNARSVLESGLQKMNLVTREEFDIQTAVLQRTREKLEALEQRVKILEEQSTNETTTQVQVQAQSGQDEVQNAL
ncbi:MAG: hypothetical protein CR991_00555 [Proteobacteria bacterium]|nr:MAG: hypothetical protein CR991_00555 [Pseudomonadota bacterium]